jgi:spore germination protein GerM
VNTAAKGEEEKTKSREVVLYFSDDQAMYLVGEKRSLENPTAKSIVAELVKGPSAQSETKLYETLPNDLEVIDVQVKDDIATVDFKSSATEKISGGSTGEGMALYSIINTLILDKELGITKVQFLVEGKNVESIKGHYDVTEPMLSDIGKIKK